MGDKPAQWIVLIEKTPRGPLSEAEIKTLLSQGVVRINDIAYKVESSDSSRAEWKFLWQFVEFDRRNSTHSEREAFRERERRTTKEQTELKEEANSLLPNELSAIQPEDLVFHSTSSDEKRIDSELPDRLPDLPQGSKFSGQSRWLLAAPLVLVIGYALTRVQLKTEVVEEPKKEMRLPLADEDDVPITRAPTATSQPVRPAAPPIRPSLRLQKPAPSLPKPADAGEISYDDYRRQRDEQLEKERQEEEERYREELAEEEGLEDEKPAKKVKKKRKPAKADEDEEFEAGVQEPEEQLEEEPEDVE